jgi:hypothetical protein
MRRGPFDSLQEISRNFKRAGVLEPQIEAIELKIGWLEVEWLKTRREKVFNAV